jgi:hypothetical protein
MGYLSMEKAQQIEEALEVYKEIKIKGDAI